MWCNAYTQIKLGSDEQCVYRESDASDAAVLKDVGAFVRTRPGYEGMTEEEVRAFSIPRIARYKVPKRVFFVDDFPMTPSMKVQKFRLREMAQEFIAQGR